MCFACNRKPRKVITFRVVGRNGSPVDAEMPVCWWHLIGGWTRPFPMEISRRSA